MALMCNPDQDWLSMPVKRRSSLHQSVDSYAIPMFEENGNSNRTKLNKIASLLDGPESIIQKIQLITCT
ncbi:hypothetical protein DPMN_177530 [Dreissena polymorpha]|uniref:Uncharacterized protein n=1 Tax=Dreissena polymorpha TaxID=45954 RepID=A0A9D4EAE2_DREPO|nr:hypothetical protein DPMN_177530 [Dreissena polymorpha]